MKRGPLWWWLGVGAIPLVLAAGVLALFIVAGAFSSEGQPADVPAADLPAVEQLEGSPEPVTEGQVSPEPDATVEHPQPTATGRFEVPALGVDAKLDDMKVIEGAVDPPNFTDAFRITGSAYGNVRDPGTGTAYVALHSARGFDAIGNALIDRISGTSRVAVGTEVVVDGVPLTVTRVETVAKDDLAYLDGAWDGSSDVVIITCQQHGDGRPSQNSVVFADRG